MIEYKEFEKCIKLVQEYYEKCNKLDKTIRELNPENGFLGICNLDTCILDLLTKLMNDKYELIYDWFFDMDCGEKNTEIYDRNSNKVIANLKTIKDLYNYLQNK